MSTLRWIHPFDLDKIVYLDLLVYMKNKEHIDNLLEALEDANADEEDLKAMADSVYVKLLGEDKKWMAGGAQMLGDKKDL